MKLQQTTEKVLQVVYTILCRTIQACLSLYITVLLILPICTVLWLINEIGRKYISFRLKKFKDGTLYSLVDTVEDNIWSFKKSGNSKNNLIFTLSKNIKPNTANPIPDLYKYRENFRTRVLDHVDKNGRKPNEKLCRIFTRKYGYACWKVDQDFNIQNHVRFYCPNPSPEKEKIILNGSDDSERNNRRDFVLESDLPDILSGLALDMSEDHPQWEEIIIPRFALSKDVVLSGGTGDERSGDGDGESICTLKPEGKIQSAKIFRFHHAYMDCLSAVTMMKTCMVDVAVDGGGKGGQTGAGVGVNNKACQEDLDPLAPLKLGMVEKVTQLVYLITFGATELIRNVFREASNNSRYSMTRYSRKNLHSWSEPIDMKLIENIKMKAGCCTDEILSSALGGALRSVSEHYCKKPEWLIFPDSFEESVFMGVIKYILPYPSENPMNRVGSVGLDISTAKLESKLERLRRVKESYGEHVHGSPVPLLNYLLMRFLGRFPCWVIQRTVSETGAPVILSNIPRIQSRVSLMGDEIHEFALWMPLLSQSGLGVVATKYCDSMRLCGVTEVACMSLNELNYVLKVMRNEILLLGKECGADTS